MQGLEGAGHQRQVPAEDVGLGVHQPRHGVVSGGMKQLVNTLNTRDLSRDVIVVNWQNNQ